MRKTIVKYGLISGSIAAVFLAVMCSFLDKKGFDYGMLIGFSGMVLAFLFIYFGVRSYRDKECGGQISFGKALGVGLLIMCVTCICYVIAWEIIYHVFFPDFYEKYTNDIIEKIKHSNLSAADMDKKITRANQDREMYKNPIMVILFTLCEPLPMGVPISLISALILKRKKAKA